MEGSNIKLQKWAIGICLVITSLKGVSSMKLHRDLKISQKSAWHMAHRIRMAWNGESASTSHGRRTSTVWRSFWAIMKRGYYGVNEFSGRHSDYCLDTMDQMIGVARGMVGQRLRYDLIKPNGRPSDRELAA